MDYLEYFKSKPGFKRFIIGLKEKYESLGKFTGTIRLKNITEEEKETFEKFFGENYDIGDNISISLKKFNTIISKSRFKNFDYYHLITTYLDIDDIKTNKVKKEESNVLYLNYIEDILNSMQNTEFIHLIMDNILKVNNISKTIKTRYTKNKKELKDILIKIDKLLSNKPKYPTSLPIYASITGNPHFLDFNTSTGSIFLKLLSKLVNKNIETTGDKWQLLESINVYNDTISNYTLTNNLLGSNEVKSFNQKMGPVNLNLDNIAKLPQITGINNKIFIFENPSLLNYLKKEDITIIITSGIPNLSFYRLIEKIEKDTEIYYNGDFDPEGLLIANKLKVLYPNLHLICYESSDYFNTLLSESVSIRRLKKLEHVHVSELGIIKKLLLEVKKAGYQENNLNRIKECIKDI